MKLYVFFLNLHSFGQRAMFVTFLPSDEQAWLFCADNDHTSTVIVDFSVYTRIMNCTKASIVAQELAASFAVIHPPEEDQITQLGLRVIFDCDVAETKRKRAIHVTVDGTLKVKCCCTTIARAAGLDDNS